MFQADESRVGPIDFLTFLAISILNLKFLAFWTYLMMNCFPKYKRLLRFADYIGYVFFIKSRKNLENFKKIVKNNNQKKENLKKRVRNYIIIYLEKKDFY